MRYTIVIPVYNVEAYIVDCLDSIALQEYKDMEVICVDDGSTDSSLALMQKWQQVHPDIMLRILEQANKRQAAARNRAFDVAQGEYIIMLDSDDVMKPDFLKMLSEHIDRTHAELIAYNVENWYPEDNDRHEYDKVYSHPHYCEFDNGKDFLEYYVALKHWGPTGMFFIFKRSIIEKHHLRFREGIFHEDDLFIPKMCYYAEKSIVCPDLVYQYRIRSGSTMRSIKLENATYKMEVADELEAFFKRENFYNQTTKSIVFNIALTGFNHFRELGRKDLLTKNYYQMVWRNAAWKRKLKIILSFFRS